MDLEVPHPTYTKGQKRLLKQWATAAAGSRPAFTARSIGSLRRTKKPAADSGNSSSTDDAYFQKFWDTQLQLMGDRLVDLTELSVVSPTTHRDMSVAPTGDKGHGDSIAHSNGHDGNLMVTRLFESAEYRYVRMTLMSGKHVQVFTSVWYPRSPRLPVLACDLLRFGGGGTSGDEEPQSQHPNARHVCIVDYQPVVVADSDAEMDEGNATFGEHRRHREEIESRVESIRDAYPGLHGQMSKRFYPEGSPYFSSQMLLGRWSGNYFTNGGIDSFEEPGSQYQSAQEMVHDVYKAWRAYVDRHVTWSQQEKRQQQKMEAKDDRELLRQRHAAYDRFSAKHDPALPMLGRLYGSEWADAYVHEVLFPLSRLEP
jgi:hypothetical protein